MSHIFISYSRKNLDFAQKIVNALAENDLDTWIDWESIPKGEDWEQEIYRGIEGADAFLFLFSPDSVASEMCNKELSCAVRNGKRILPIVVRDTERRIIPDEISKRNWIFCREEKDDFKKAIAETRETIQTDYEWLKYHTRLQVKALEWERKKDASQHLRGKDLRDAEEQLASSGQKEPQPTDLQRQFVLASRAGQTRTRNIVIVIASIVLIALGLLSTVAVNQRNLANYQAQTAVAAQAQTEEQRRVAVSRQLAAQAGNTLSNQPDLATMLSLESNRSADTFESRDMLLKSILHKPHLTRVLKFESVPLSLGFSLDGKYLAVGFNDGLIEIRRTETWKKTATFQSDLGRIRNLSFDSSGRHVIAIYCSYDDEIYYIENCRFIVWDLKTETPTILSPLDAQWPAAVSTDGSLLVFSTSIGFQLWDVVGDKPLGSTVFTHLGMGPLTFVFSPDNDWLLAGECSFSVETGCFEGLIEGWEISDWNLEAQENSTILGTQGNAVVSLSVDPLGQYLASGSCIHLDSLLGNCPGGEVKLWVFIKDSNGKSTLRPATASEFTQSGPVFNMALSYESGGVLAASGNDSQVNLYVEPSHFSLGNPWNTTTFIASVDTIVANAISPNGRWLATAGGTTVTLWDIDPEPVLRQMIDAPIYAIISLGINEDNILLGADDYGSLWNIDPDSGNLGDPGIEIQLPAITIITPKGNPVGLISSDGDALPRLVDLKTSQPVSPPLNGFPEYWTIAGMAYRAYAVSSDHKYLAASGTSQVVLWDLTSSNGTGPLSSIPLEGGTGGMSLGFSHDGRYLAAGAETGGVTIWNVAEQTVVDTLYSGADTPFASLAFTPDDRILAVAVCTRHAILDEGGDVCRNSEIRLWDLVTRQPFGSPLPTVSDYILGLGFDANGTRLFAFPYLSSGYEVWNFNVQDWTQIACDAAGRNFTQAEWTQYFPGEEYRSTCPQWPAGE